LEAWLLRHGRPVGPYFDVFSAPGQSPAKPDIQVGVTYRRFQSFAQSGLRTSIAQYYGIVQDGLENARHLFQGLRRPLRDANGNMDADRNVLIYAWRPDQDWVWMGGNDNGRPQPKIPVAKRVFVVLVTMLQNPDEHGVSGVIEYWNWVEEDRETNLAPIAWADRYQDKLWSR
jgi:hypothetical protein